MLWILKPESYTKINKLLNLNYLNFLLPKIKAICLKCLCANSEQNLKSNINFK